VTGAAVDHFLPRGSGVERFWRLGPHADLVGTEADELAGASNGPVDATLRDADRFDLPEQPATVPALLRLGVADDLLWEQLAVSVNGIVGAVAPAIPTEAGTEVAVMVDDALFRTGPNEVVVYRLTA
jgi:hypothetical protein